MQIEYITTRDLVNSKGEVKGKVRIIKLVGEEEATLELNCPECGYSEKRKEKWEEPFVSGQGQNQKFYVKCSKCDFSVRLLKLKKEIKQLTKKK
jgi:predicted nucleic-acid-binding Zn-ribbon protein